VTLPILYSFRRCPYAMRARMALDVAARPVEHREVRLRDKPSAMLDASPKGTVPVLVTNAGVIDESLDIMMWALGQNDPDNWLANGAQDRADTEAFLADFKDQLDRYKYASRYDSTVARGAVDLDYREKALATLATLTTPLKSTLFLRGERPRLIDVATFPFIRQFAAVEPAWWADCAPQGTAQWLTDWLQSERFKRIMVKHDV
jgi:glutathione S-transferase